MGGLLGLLDKMGAMDPKHGERLRLENYVSGCHAKVTVHCLMSFLC